MTNKLGQSIMEFINFFPLQSVNVNRAPLSNKESQVLYDIWKSGKDSHGYLIVPESLDPMVVSGLMVKGYIERGKNSAVFSNTQSVGITKKGKDIIKNIVLFTEKSTFEKGKNSPIDYESIHIALENKPAVLADTKCANWLNKIKPTFSNSSVRQLHGFLEKIQTDVTACLETMEILEEQEMISRDSTDVKRISIADCVNSMGYHLQQITTGSQFIQDALDQKIY